MIGNKLKEIRESTGMNKKEFAQYIGLKYTTYNNYETEAREPASDFLILISEKFDVSIDYLLGLKDEMEILHSYQLKAGEYDHIKKYRELDDYGKETVDITLSRETERIEKYGKLPDSPATIIDIDTHHERTGRLVEYFRSASAGSGIFILGNEIADQIAIPDTSENRDVDYAIKVSGESMAPDFHDGDTVLVSQRKEMSVGDVGIFVKNGDAFIKELGKDRLISRNKEAGFEDITILDSDNVVCMGKVIGKL